MDLLSFLNVEAMLNTFGYAALFGFIFAESGLFFGFILPGDSLIFTAGLLAQKGYLNISFVIIGGIICAFLGDQVGYWTGDKFGMGFFSKPGDFFRDPKHVKRANDFFEKHGKKTIVMARFVPAVRTFVPIVAGTAKMDYKSFVAYNFLGGALWVTAFSALGYFFGSVLPNSAEYVSVAIIAIIAISLLPIAYEFHKENPDAIEKIKGKFAGMKKGSKK